MPEGVPYAELHCRSNFSFLEGASHPEELVERAQALGLEALARWEHRKLGLLSPGAFIPVAEETGLILPLGEWALEEACRQTKAWHDAGLNPPPVAVNLSAREFNDPRLIERVRQVLAEIGRAHV